MFTSFSSAPGRVGKPDWRIFLLSVVATSTAKLVPLARSWRPEESTPEAVSAARAHSAQSVYIRTALLMCLG